MLVFEGFRMDARTRDMLIAAREICDAPLVITQGGYNKGGVVASAGTHDGGGALDIRATNLSGSQRAEAVAKLRRVGFAAWLRTPAQSNWPYHIHCIAMGCPDASAGAKQQMTAYKNHRNGLASNGPDDGRPLYSGVTWESFAKGYFMSAAEVADLKKVLGGKIDTLGQTVSAMASQVRTLTAAEAARYQRYETLFSAIRNAGDANSDEELAAIKALADKIGPPVPKV